MKKIFPILLLLLASWAGGCTPSNEPKAEAPEPRGTENVAYQWGKIALEATANNTETFRPRPTITSRMLALVFTSMFDAWSRYDAKATPVYLKVDRRPESEQTLSNKEKAISYAAYGAFNEYFYTDTALVRAKMIQLGFDPNDHSMDPTTPQGIGNLAAKTVIEARHHDGSNQYGEQAGAEGIPYADFTNYTPKNDPDHNLDLEHWQPKYFSDGKGGKFAPPCLTPHWFKVKPFGLDSASEFRPGPPPAIGSEQLAKEVQEVIDVNANLTNEQKALVEFMRDGPKSVQQAGHWLIFAQTVSRRDNHTLDDDVKMYFLVENAAMDAFIASWDAKMYYDFARPYALVHEMHRDKDIQAWAGPHQGTKTMKGQDWVPYSPETFVCPPFPSYVSGHSTVSGACSEALRLFTGSDTFGTKVRLLPGFLTEPGITQDSVTLDFPTFTNAADQAGISRVLGGYHIQADNLEGLALGRKVGNKVYEKYLRYVGE